MLTANSITGCARALSDVKYKIIQYMETRSIDKDIQYRVLNQLEVRHQEEHRLQGVFLGNEILQNIPQKLVEEIKIDFYGKIIKQSPFLTSFSLTFQNQLAQCMQEAVLRPGDIIFQRGDQGNKLYYLNSGHVQFYIPMGKFGRLKKSIVSIKVTRCAASLPNQSHNRITHTIERSAGGLARWHISCMLALRLAPAKHS